MIYYTFYEEICLYFRIPIQPFYVLKNSIVRLYILFQILDPINSIPYICITIIHFQIVHTTAKQLIIYFVAINLFQQLSRRFWNIYIRQILKTSQMLKIFVPKCKLNII